MSTEVREQGSQNLCPIRMQVSLRSWQRNRLWLKMVLLCLVCGCGPDAEQRPPLHPVQGSLTINGAPAEGALLVFHPVSDEPLDDRGTRPTATVDADGSFALTTYQEGDGAPVGDYRVTILWFDNPEASSPWEKLGNRFADPTASDIRITVDPQHNQLEPIRIDGVPVLPRRAANNANDLDQVD